MNSTVRYYDAVRPPAHPAAGENNVVAIDSTVEIRDLSSNERETYTLVHPSKANILNNRISSFSPMGRALFGRRVGEIVEFDAPRGAVRVVIEEIRGAEENR